MAKKLNVLTDALDMESWEWLQDNLPAIAGAVSAEVENGATAEDVKRTVNTHTTRYALSLRCEQAARYLVRLKGE